MTGFQKTLTDWYQINKRDLPWRDTTDPYKIWLSEIILQQTRVAQGMDYYFRFIDAFPDVQSLAEAHEDQVLKLWQGLGYYSRARNLHHAAKEICEKFDGKFPTLHSDIIRLKGIGSYTAAAICSFAYLQPYAVVDGNVFRVLSRVFGIDTPIDSPKGKKEFEQLAESLLPKLHSAEYNQTIMEFGALQCVPVRPDCGNCPLSESCIALSKDAVNKFPVKSKATKVTERFFNYLFIRHDGKTYLQKRTQKDIWKNLYELPLIESDHLFTAAELCDNEVFTQLFGSTAQVKIQKEQYDFKHILTHRKIYARFFSIETDNICSLPGWIEIPQKDLDHYAVSRLTELFLEKSLI